ncbi:hypothetical protein R5O87_06785 [Arthrobacter globiformis]|uniref:hypothetical protein n=1 Tax=Arthrobacter globiformis TaxID=1665 RepID=UPI00397C7E87
MQAECSLPARKTGYPKSAHRAPEERTFAIMGRKLNSATGRATASSVFAGTQPFRANE